jgi:hypothetical protein
VTSRYRRRPTVTGIPGRRWAFGPPGPVPPSLRRGRAPGAPSHAASHAGGRDSTPRAPRRFAVAAGRLVPGRRAPGRSQRRGGHSSRCPGGAYARMPSWRATGAPGRVRRATEASGKPRAAGAPLALHRQPRAERAC